MTTLTALARIEAVDAGRAAPIATVRHVHLHERPLVLIPLTMAGEANAPLAVMIGDDRHAPRLLVVPDPRNRDMRFAFAARLAEIVLGYVEGFARSVEEVAGRGRDLRTRYADAPQILVPNTGGIGFVRLLGRSTRFRRTEGEYAVDPLVPELGKWLTFLADRAEEPGSCMLLAATQVLAGHWATGQSATEDANLAALLGWIDPPAGRSGAEAAIEAENPLLWPPAGPSTDPTFDNVVLAGIIQARNVPEMERALTGQLSPTWELMWRAVDLLCELPEGGSVAGRWDRDKDEYTSYTRYLQETGLPQARRDSAVAAARRLHSLEHAQNRYAAQRALDDPLVLAEQRMSGEAFAGTVVAADPLRVTPGPTGRRVLRPLVRIKTSDPVQLAVGTKLVSPARPKQDVYVTEVGNGEVEVELINGMGRTLTPEPGSVPEVGERLAYTSFLPDFQPAGTLPDRENTPWTHGGPPPTYEPNDDDAREVWE